MFFWYHVATFLESADSDWFLWCIMGISKERTFQSTGKIVIMNLWAVYWTRERIETHPETLGNRSMESTGQFAWLCADDQQVGLPQALLPNRFSRTQSTWTRPDKERRKEKRWKKNRQTNKKKERGKAKKKQSSNGTKALTLLIIRAQDASLTNGKNGKTSKRGGKGVLAWMVCGPVLEREILE